MSSPSTPAGMAAARRTTTDLIRKWLAPWVARKKSAALSTKADAPQNLLPTADAATSATPPQTPSQFMPTAKIDSIVPHTPVPAAASQSALLTSQAINLRLAALTGPKDGRAEKLIKAAALAARAHDMALRESATPKPAPTRAQDIAAAIVSRREKLTHEFGEPERSRLEREASILEGRLAALGDDERDAAAREAHIQHRLSPAAIAADALRVVAMREEKNSPRADGSLPSGASRRGRLARDIAALEADLRERRQLARGAKLRAEFERLDAGSQERVDFLKEHAPALLADQKARDEGKL